MRFNKRALCAAAALTFAGGAAAQSSVTLYGSVDAFGEYLANGSTHSFSQRSGGSSSTAFGLKGDEDLGGGLHAKFVLENGFNVNNGTFFVDSGSMFYRQAWVGLAHERYGTVTLGRQYQPSFYAVYPAEPFSANETLSPLAAAILAPDARTVATQYAAGRESNSMMYQSPYLAGARLYAMYSLAATTSVPIPTRGGNSLDLALNWTNGTLYAGLGYQLQHGGEESAPLAPGALTPVDLMSTEHFVGALAWQIGIVKLQGIYEYARPKTPEAGSLVAAAGLAHALNVAELGATIQATSADQFKFAAIQRNVRGAHDNAIGFQFGVDHNLSKRTAVYARAGYIKNNGTSTMSWPGVSVTEPDTKQVLAVVGMSHRF